MKQIGSKTTKARFHTSNVVNMERRTLIRNPNAKPVAVEPCVERRASATTEVVTADNSVVDNNNNNNHSVPHLSQHRTMGIDSNKRRSSVSAAMARGGKFCKKGEKGGYPTETKNGVEIYENHLTACKVCRRKVEIDQCKKAGTQPPPPVKRSHDTKCPLNKSTKEKMAEKPPQLSFQRKPAANVQPKQKQARPKHATQAAKIDEDQIRMLAKAGDKAAKFRALIGDMGDDEKEELEKKFKAPVAVAGMMARLIQMMDLRRSKEPLDGNEANIAPSDKSKKMQKAFFGNGLECILPDDDTHTGKNWVRTSTLYEWAQAFSLFYVDWEMADPNVELYCTEIVESDDPLKENSMCNKPLVRDRTNFSKHSTLTPMWRGNGCLSFVVSMTYKCTHCSGKCFSATEPSIEIPS